MNSFTHTTSLHFSDSWVECGQCGHIDIPYLDGETNEDLCRGCDWSLTGVLTMWVPEGCLLVDEGELLP